MSKQRERHTVTETPVGSADQTPAPVAADMVPSNDKEIEAKDGRGLPLWLKLSFAVCIALGALMWLTRQSRTESGAYSAISSCDASVLAESDGLKDLYGLVQFKSNSSEVANFMSLCASDPDLARRVFRRALDEGNKSARLIALSSAFYLSANLQKEDIERIVRHLSAETEKEADVRRAAQRVLSDLTVIKDAGEASKYQAVPDGLPEPAAGAPSHSIQTKEETWSKEQVLLVRWTDPELANAWWKGIGSTGALTAMNEGEKGLERQRFVISHSTGSGQGPKAATH